MTLTTKVLLNKTYQKNDGTFPLIIRTTYNRNVIRIPVGISLPETDWDQRNQRIKSNSTVADNTTRINRRIQAKVQSIYDVFTRLEDEGQIHKLNLTQIKKIITGKADDTKKDVFVFIEDIVASLLKAKRKGNAEVYLGLSKKLKSFNGSERLSFDDINYQFLKRMEIAHYSKDNEAGGLSVYLRTLRAVYNQAIRSGFAKRENYPFSEYRIKKGVPKRRALDDLEFEKFRSIQLLEGSPLAKARKLYLASIYLRGMNWMDMALLRKSNILGEFERITYIRQKTRNKRFSIKISEPLKNMIKENLSDIHDGDTFLFPILTDEIKEETYHETIKNKRKKLNKRLKEIAMLLEIEPFTIYSARHTYAMLLKRNGAPANIIQDSLGHTTEEMTQNYLESFGDTVIDEYDDILINRLNL